MSVHVCSIVLRNKVEKARGKQMKPRLRLSSVYGSKKAACRASLSQILPCPAVGSHLAETAPITCKDL